MQPICTDVLKTSKILYRTRRSWIDLEERSSVKWGHNPSSLLLSSYYSFPLIIPHSFYFSCLSSRPHFSRPSHGCMIYKYSLARVSSSKKIPSHGTNFFKKFQNLALMNIFFVVRIKIELLLQKNTETGIIFQQKSPQTRVA